MVEAGSRCYFCLWSQKESGRKLSPHLDFDSPRRLFMEAAESTELKVAIKEGSHCYPDWKFPDYLDCICLAAFCVSGSASWGTKMTTITSWSLWWSRIRLMVTLDHSFLTIKILAITEEKSHVFPFAPFRGLFRGTNMIWIFSLTEIPIHRKYVFPFGTMYQMYILGTWLFQTSVTRKLPW